MVDQGGREFLSGNGEEYIYHSERTLANGGAAVLGIGDNTSFLVINSRASIRGEKNNFFIIFSPNGFTGERSFLVPIKDITTIGRSHLCPISKNGGEDLIVSRDHLNLYRDPTGSLHITDISSNGTTVREAGDLSSSSGVVNIKNQAVRVDNPESARLKLPGGVVLRLERKKKSFVIVDNNSNKTIGKIKINKKTGAGFFTITREHLSPLVDEGLVEDISRFHCSLIWTEDGGLYVYDHSTNGTEVSLIEAESVGRSPESITADAEPEVVISRVYHQEQQIKGDPHSVGGDYWLRGGDVLKNKKLYGQDVDPDDLLRKGGNAVVVMDTATIQTRGETPATTTRPFAHEFLQAYYWDIAKYNCSPLQAANAAWQWVYNKEGLGSRTDATFTFVSVVDNETGGKKAVILHIGNTDVKFVSSSGVISVTTPMEKISYYDYQVGGIVNPTVLVSSGIDKVQVLERIISSDIDHIFVHTDGVLQIDPKNPKRSALNQDDALLLGIPLKREKRVLERLKEFLS